MISLFQNFVGTSFELTADLAILNAPEDELCGGRRDDDARALDITSALSDDSVSAILAVRGGAWFTRILPKINFKVLDRRKVPIFVFGFSELTPLVNIVAGYPLGYGFHDVGPAFLVYGLKYAAEKNLGLNDKSVPTSQDWMVENLYEQIRSYLQRTVRILERRDEPLALFADLVAGNWPASPPTRLVGGNLTVLSTLIGSPFEPYIIPEGKWLILEDFNDKLERFDRFLSHFTLAGYWNKCGGLVLGDFHRGSFDLNGPVFEILQRHIPSPVMFPILRSATVGHVWPVVPIPLNHPGHWTNISKSRYSWHSLPFANSPKQ